MENGKPMQIEVPSDKYDAAVAAMKDKIKKGKIPGITDPEEAKNIVRKGNFTYEQAKNIARAGTIESLTYDAVNGIIIASIPFGVSAAITFATSVWNGEDIDVALRLACWSGLKVGGTVFAASVLGSQLAKAGMNGALVGGSEAIVRMMGPKAAAVLANAFRSGANIYGIAATKSAAKLLRGNAITGLATFAVLSVADVANIFQGRISGGQLFKNMAGTAASVAGGLGGWTAGAAAGAAAGSVIPILGTAVGGVVGGLVGAMLAGSAAQGVTDSVLDVFIEDDAKEMVKIIEEEFKTLAVDNLLNETECENAVEELKKKLDGSTLKDMYASDDRPGFANNLLTPVIEKEIPKREKIYLPAVSRWQIGLREILEDIADNSENLATAVL